MQINGLLYSLPKEIKVLIGVFIIVLSIGFFSGIFFVGKTSSVNPNGIQEQYLGNEHDEDAEIMKFKKGENEMLSLVHSHVLSMSMIFFLLGIILSITELKNKVKLFLMIEPLISVLLTFGGIYFLWKGFLWMKYLIIFSGTLMTLTFSISVIIILRQLLQKKL